MSEAIFKCSRTVFIFPHNQNLLFIFNIHHQCISNCVNRFYVRVSNLWLRLFFFYLSPASGRTCLLTTKDKVNLRSAKLEQSLFNKLYTSATNIDTVAQDNIVCINIKCDTTTIHTICSIIQYRGHLSISIFSLSFNL